MVSFEEQFDMDYVEEYAESPDDTVNKDEKKDNYRTVKVVKERFFKMDGTNMFGIYIVREVDSNGHTPLETNVKGEATIKGSTRRLSEGENYRIEVGNVQNDKRWGAQYEISSVEQEKLDTIASQDAYLKSIITERQFDIIKSAYPNCKLVDLISNDEVDLSKLKGIKEKTMESIKEKIESTQSIAVLVSKLVEYNLRTSLLKKVMLHFGNNAQKAYDVIVSNPYALTEVDGVGFGTIDSQVKHVIGLEDSRRVHSAMVYGIKKAVSNGGHVYMPADELVQNVQDLIPEVDRGTIKEAIDANKNIAHETIDHEEVVGIANMWHVEEQIYLELKRISDTFKIMHSKEEIDKGIALLEEEQGFEFTLEQREATHGALTHGVSILTGGGGVGKSATVVSICKAIEKLNYATCALSGKASNVLFKRGLLSSTLHRLLKYDGNGFARNMEEPLNLHLGVFDEISMASLPIILSYLQAIPNGTGIVFVGDPNQLPAIGYGDMLRDLLATKEKKPDFFVQVYKLTVTHRQAEKSGTIQVANAISRHEFYVDKSQQFQIYGENEDLFIGYLENKQEIEDLAVNIATKFKTEKVKNPEDMLDIQFISPRKGSGELKEDEFNTTRSLNIKLQKIFNDFHNNSAGMKIGDFTYLPYDKIMHVTNAYDTLLFKSLENALESQDPSCMVLVYDDQGNAIGEFSVPSLVREFGVKEANIALAKHFNAECKDVYNGTFGIIQHVDKDFIVVEYEGLNGYVVVPKAEVMSSVTLAYATTIHKMQGSSAKYVITTMDNSAYLMLSRQLLYTALTRTEVKHYLLTTFSAMTQALVTDASNSRRTRLARIANGDSNILFAKSRKGKDLVSILESDRIDGTSFSSNEVDNHITF